MSRAAGRTGRAATTRKRRISPVDRTELEPSEFSWGPGLTPPDLAEALPREGGMYSGKAPGSEKLLGLLALAAELADRNARGSSASGPGDGGSS